MQAITTIALNIAKVHGVDAARYPHSWLHRDTCRSNHRSVARQIAINPNSGANRISRIAGTSSYRFRHYAESGSRKQDCYPPGEPVGQ